MCHLLHAGRKTARQHIEIVAHGGGRFDEAAVRHHQRAGEIVGERNTQQLRHIRCGGPRLSHQPLEVVRTGQQRDLRRGLKHAGGVRQHLGEEQPPVVAIVAALFVWHGMKRQHGDANLVGVAQMRTQGGQQIVARVQRSVKSFCREIERSNVIVAAVEILTHLFHRITAVLRG